MRIVSINTVFFGSTGKIMLGINELAKQNGYETLSVSGFVLGKTNTPENSIVIGGPVSKTLHKILAKFTGFQGVFSYFATKKALKIIDSFAPDIIHLHNLHAWFINLPLLFKYIKKKGIKVVWTLHDCWPITAQCTHFTLAKCDKWQTGCCNCPQFREYPETFIDSTKLMYKLRKKWFTGVKDLTVVTPSVWLSNLVKKSFLCGYPIKVINNGIDLALFCPTESDFREKYGILPTQKIILGVSFGWGYSKGLDVFCELSKRLDENCYKIVLVGTDSETDKELPKNIISIHKTANQKELAEIYSAADVFVNATRQDNFPTVNIEALACGTPVITFKTGGSTEIIDEFSGSAVDVNELDFLEKEIIRILKDKPFGEKSCIERAKSFDMNDRFMEYIKLYEELNSK